MKGMAFQSRESHIAVCNVKAAATYCKHIALKTLTKGKRKRVPVHVMKATGVTNVQLHSFLTTSVDGGERSTSFLGRCTPRKGTPLLTEYEAVWAPEPVWSF